MATHSSVLAWRIPGTAEPGGLPSMGSPLEVRPSSVAPDPAESRRCARPSGVPRGPATSTGSLAIPGPLSKRKRRLDSLEAAQGAPRDPRRDSRGERSTWLPLETRPDSPGEPGMQPRPVGEGTTRRGTATPVHRPQRPAGSTHSSTSCLRPPEQLERPAGLKQ